MAGGAFRRQIFAKVAVALGGDRCGSGRLNRTSLDDKRHQQKRGREHNERKTGIAGSKPFATQTPVAA